MSNIMYLRGSVLTLALLLAYLLTQSVKWVMTEIALLKYTVEWRYKNFLSVIITHVCDNNTYCWTRKGRGQATGLGQLCEFSSVLW